MCFSGTLLTHVKLSVCRARPLKRIKAAIGVCHALNHVQKVSCKCILPAGLSGLMCLLRGSGAPVATFLRLGLLWWKRALFLNRRADLLPSLQTGSCEGSVHSVVRAVMLPRCSWICRSALESRDSWFLWGSFMSLAKGGQGPDTGGCCRGWWGQSRHLGLCYLKSRLTTCLRS